MMHDLIFREPTFQQSHQHERRTIADIERNMISDWLSQSTTQQPLQEDMQYMKLKLQNSETQVTSILEHLMDEEELPPQPVFDSDETVNADTSKSVEFDEFSIVDEHLSEPEETIDVSSHEPDITIAPYDDDDVALEIGVISERSEEPQKENKEDQPLVLVKPPTLPCIFATPYTRVEVKERSRIFYTADTFVLDDHDMTNSFVLEVPNELRTLKEGMHAALPKAVDAPFDFRSARLNSGRKTTRNRVCICPDSFDIENCANTHLEANLPGPHVIEEDQGAFVAIKQQAFTGFRAANTLNYAPSWRKLFCLRTLLFASLSRSYYGVWVRTSTRRKPDSLEIAVLIVHPAYGGCFYNSVTILVKNEISGNRVLAAYCASKNDDGVVFFLGLTVLTVVYGVFVALVQLCRVFREITSFKLTKSHIKSLPHSHREMQQRNARARSGGTQAHVAARSAGTSARCGRALA
ncbi:hypothetical protein Syun_006232 [Stephania yunnanensis]|uniref:Uncharacterized protein n=1 Tax=Stephania yunnanensis TaxID=152371 RepID=A0AAP0KWA7_9MAGN